MSNEFQAAYDLSRREYVSGNERQRAVELTRQGKVVVVCDHEACCPFTDALIAVELRILGIYDTIEQSNADFKFDDQFCGEAPYIFKERETWT